MRTSCSTLTHQHQWEPLKIKGSYFPDSTQQGQMVVTEMENKMVWPVSVWGHARACTRMWAANTHSAGDCCEVPVVVLGPTGPCVSLLGQKDVASGGAEHHVLLEPHQGFQAESNLSICCAYFLLTCVIKSKLPGTKQKEWKNEGGWRLQPSCLQEEVVKWHWGKHWVFPIVGLPVLTQIFSVCKYVLEAVDRCIFVSSLLKDRIWHPASLSLLFVSSRLPFSPVHMTAIKR